MTGPSDDVGRRKLIDRLLAKPQHGPRLGVVATTYELDREFLEIDFLPSLLELGAWDDRSWASRIAVEKALAGLEAAAILTDASCYRGRPYSLRLDVQPVYVGPGAKLHAKVLLVVHDQAVRLVVGSANLTENGFRKNREVAGVIEATPKDPSGCALIQSAILGFENVLGPWRGKDADHVLSLAGKRLASWSSAGSNNEEDWFVWSSGQVQLWREFVARWPSSEPVTRITIVSPFWSAEEKAGPIVLFLKGLKEVGALNSAETELRLLTEAKPDPSGSLIPCFGSGLPHVPMDIAGLRATAHAVDPSVTSDEVDMDGFSATRPLHAKVVLLEGPSTALAYVGSANFSRHGWGFGGGLANVEAGLVIRRSGKQRQALVQLIPATVGEPVLLTGDWTAKVAVERSSVDVPPWPQFLRSIRLVLAPGDSDRLDLQVEMDPGQVAGAWSLHFVGDLALNEGVVLSGERGGDGSIRVALEPSALERILRDKELRIRWWAFEDGRDVPVNVAFEARDALPVAPGAGRPGELMLIGYYQGRILFEEMFPPPAGEPFDGEQPQPVVEPSAVDTSRIQSYQIREFVEALPGLAADLGEARTAGATIRLALVGPVSPLALATEVHRAVREHRRTPVAGGFQIVEILSCLFQAQKLDVPAQHAQVWNEYVGKAIGQVEGILAEMKAASPGDLVNATSFGKYEKALRKVRSQGGRGA